MQNSRKDNFQEAMKQERTTPEERKTKQPKLYKLSDIMNSVLLQQLYKIILNLHVYSNFTLRLQLI